MKVDGCCDVRARVWTSAGFGSRSGGCTARFVWFTDGLDMQSGHRGGLAAIQAISPTSIITHNYTLNRLKNRVTTNQPGSHGGREK